MLENENYMRERAEQVIGDLRRENGLSLRRLFSRGVSEDWALQVMQLLIDERRVFELDGRYWLAEEELDAKKSARRKVGDEGANQVERRQVELEAVLMALEVAGRCLRTSDIAQHVGLPVRDVSKRLRALAKDGKVKQVARGEWGLIDFEVPAAPVEQQIAAGATSAGPLDAYQRLLKDIRLEGAARDVGELHPVLVELLRVLPPAGCAFKAKDRFVVAWGACVDLIYPEDIAEAAQ